MEREEENRFKEWMGKGKGNAVKGTTQKPGLLQQTRISCTQASGSAAALLSSAGLCWDSLSLLSLCPKIKRQPLSGASYTRKQKPKGQAILKVLLKVSTQNWSLCLPSTRHWSKQAVTQQSPKLRGQEGEYTVPIRKDGQVGGWMNN